MESKARMMGLDPRFAYCVLFCLQLLVWSLVVRFRQECAACLCSS